MRMRVESGKLRLGKLAERAGAHFKSKPPSEALPLSPADIPWLCYFPARSFWSSPVCRLGGCIAAGDPEVK